MVRRILTLANAKVGGRQLKHRTTIGFLICIALVIAAAPVISAGMSVGFKAISYNEIGQTVLEPGSSVNSGVPKPLPALNNGGCGGGYEIWAVDRNDPTQPIVIADGKKVLMGTGLFENIEGNYGLPDGLGIDYGPLRDLTRDAILHLSDDPSPEVALYDPDPLAEGQTGWNQMMARLGQWPYLDDWAINPFETDSYEMVAYEWETAGPISEAAQIEDLADLYLPGGDLAYDVLILDQGAQANTPDYDSEIATIQDYLDNGGAVIISAYAFIDWASFFEVNMKPGVQQWYEADRNEQFLEAMFPDVTVIRERARVFGAGGWEWRIKDYATVADVTNQAPSSVQTLYSRTDGIHGFLRFELPLRFIVEVDFDPDTLNQLSTGKWVTVYLETPPACDPRDIDPSTVLMNGVLSPVLDPQYGWVISEDSYIVDHDNDGLEERLLKFDRASVQDILPVNSTVWINITGMTYSGIEFSGSDVIRVIDPSLSIGVSPGSLSGGIGDNPIATISFTDTRTESEF